MDKDELLNRLSRITQSTQDEWSDACAMVQRYPYSLPLRLMAAAGQKAWAPEAIDKQWLRRESLYAGSLLQPILAEAKQYQPPQERFDVMKEINAYQEVSFKTAPKSVILSKFLEEGDFPREQDNPQQGETLEALGKKSITANESLASETLAIVLEKQGKKVKALEMYEKLVELYPEKSSIFANHIERLRSELDNA